MFFFLLTGFFRFFWFLVSSLRLDDKPSDSPPHQHRAGPYEAATLQVEHSSFDIPAGKHRLSQAHIELRYA